MQVTAAPIQIQSHQYTIVLSQDEIAALSNRLVNPCAQLHPVDEAIVCALKELIATTMQSIEPPPIN